MIRSLGILVAMRQELDPLRKAWNLEWTGPGDFFTGKRRGLRLQVALSGVGPRRARSACQQLVRYGAPDLLLSLGYSGALRSQLQPGDAILADSIESLEGEVWQAHASGHGPWERGRLLWVEQLAPSVEHKRQLSQAHPDCLAVDMESGVLAREAVSVGLPWQSLRIIVDPLHKPLPLDFDRCMSLKGQTHGLKLARHIALSPHRWPALAEFARYHQRATHSLVERSSQWLRQW